MDRILIQDLQLDCIIGTNADERERKQDVIVNLAIEGDLSEAGASDRIEDTMDYTLLKRRIATMVEKSSYFLIERLAERIAEICLSDARARAVTVRLDKPGALSGARSVAVEIRREK